MGVPLVGKRHHRKADTSQGAVGMFWNDIQANQRDVRQQTLFG